MTMECVNFNSSYGKEHTTRMRLYNQSVNQMLTIWKGTLDWSFDSLRKIISTKELKVNNVEGKNIFWLFFNISEISLKQTRSVQTWLSLSLFRDLFFLQILLQASHRSYIFEQFCEKVIIFLYFWYFVIHIFVIYLNRYKKKMYWKFIFDFEQNFIPLKWYFSNKDFSARVNNYIIYCIYYNNEFIHFFRQKFEKITFFFSFFLVPF